MGLAKELRARRKQSRRKISVSEWADDDGPFSLYCRPLTCYDLNELQKRHPQVMQNPSIAAMVDLIVMKAESKDGDKLFSSAEDKIDLMGEETTVVSHIANEMFGTIEAFEDVEKN
tara:strand:+ start:120 stop:467 length:348 start_codon:yes stop_codon:yes gene_type:complete